MCAGSPREQQHRGEQMYAGSGQRMDGCVWAEVGRLLMLAWLLVWPGLAQVRHPLPVLWVMPVTPPPGWDNLTAAVAPAISLALQDLRRQPPPLGSYEIHFHLLDSQCDGAKGLKALFDAMWAGPKYLLVFGGACPSVTALIARSLPALNLVQVSFATSSPRLGNWRQYPNFFSTVPSVRAVNQAVVKLLQRYGWTRVGILTQEGARLSEMKEDLLTQLTKANVQIAATESLSDDPCSDLRKLQDRDVRIIIGQFEGDSASEVFCCAHKLNLFGGNYQWIVAGGPDRRPKHQISGCAADSLLAAMDGVIRLDISHISNRNTRGISGRTPEEYEAAYLSQLIQDGSKVSRLHGFAYDAVWVAAKALSQAMEAVKHREKYSIRRNVTVTEQELEKLLLDAVERTRFEGVTGPVLFRNSERMATIELSQFQGSSDVLVGHFSSSTQQLRLQSHMVKFKGSGPAKDRTVVVLQRRHVGPVLYGIMSSLAALTIIITLTVLCLHIRNRKHWLLREATQPRDELLLLGLLLSSSSILMSGLDGASLSDRAFDLLCSVRLWLLSVGHSIGFAVLFTKTWRVYSVFSRAGTKQKQQSCLGPPGILVAGMLLLDAFVLTSWQILDPLRRVESEHSLESGPDVLVRPDFRGMPEVSVQREVGVMLYSEYCSSSNMERWLTAVCGYKGPLLGLGCFLAWNIRAGQEVHPATHRKHLALSMGAVTLSSSLGVSGSLLMAHNAPVQFCLTSLAILSCNTFILVWLFGPVLLYIRANSSELPCDAEQVSSSAAEQLSRLNQQLRKWTTQLDVEIKTITMQLHEMSESTPPDSSHMDAETSNDNGEVSSPVRKPTESIHIANIGSEDRNSEVKRSRPEDINSPEHVRRRLSLQLPILHHAYLPVIGGVTDSRSSLFVSQESNCSRISDAFLTSGCDR